MLIMITTMITWSMILCRSWASKPGPEGSEGAPTATARRPSGRSWWWFIIFTGIRMIEPWGHMKLTFFSDVWNGDDMACLAILVWYRYDEMRIPRKIMANCFRFVSSPYISSPQQNCTARYLPLHYNATCFYWIWHRSDLASTIKQHFV